MLSKLTTTEQPSTVSAQVPHRSNSASPCKATDLLAELRNVDKFAVGFGQALLVALMDAGDLVVRQARDGEPIEGSCGVRPENVSTKCGQGQSTMSLIL